MPTGSEWVHEIKHDGYRFIGRRDADRVRVFSRRGLDWTERVPTIVAAAGELRARTVVIDGEAVGARDDGVTDFLALRSAMASRDRHGGVFLYAFDLLELDGQDRCLRRFQNVKVRAKDLKICFVTRSTPGKNSLAPGGTYARDHDRRHSRCGRPRHPGAAQRG